MDNRRHFIKQALTVSAGASLLPGLASAAALNENHHKIKLPDNAVVVFQGDSITDAGRDKTITGYNNSAQLAGGYVGMVASQLLFNNPTKKIKTYNMGVGGNKVFQLADRWDKDCLDLKPDVLSILVGVNDFWHTLTLNYKGNIDTYRNDYMKLLQRTKDKLPDVQLIIGEPFAVTGIKAVDDKWYPAFNEYRAVAREVAGSFNAVFIPYQELFDTAEQAMPGSYWLKDGVHPTLAGTQIMANTLLSVFK
jgi:lysophospholipase L1-like esterase